MTYVFPHVFAEGDAVRDQILEEILMGDGVALSVEAELAVDRWVVSGNTAEGATTWLRENMMHKQVYRPANGHDGGQVAEPDNFDDIRKWAKWLTTVIPAAREEFRLKEVYVGFNWDANQIGTTQSRCPIAWSRITTNLHNKVKTQEQQIAVLQKQAIVSENSLSDLQNHAIVQQQQIDELRSVVDALAQGQNWAQARTDTNIAPINIERGQKIVINYVEKINIEGDRIAAEEKARVEKIAIEQAIKKAADEKIATEKAAKKKAADEKAATLATMNDRVKALKVKQAKQAKARADEEKKENELIDAMNTQLELEQSSSSDGSDGEYGDISDDTNEALSNMVSGDAAELRAAKALGRGTQKGKKSNGIDTWSDAKCAQMSEGWCE